MSWTDPSGHVYSTGEVLAASTLNTYVKDDLIDLDRRTTITGATVATAETTTSGTYANLATSGPAVTVTVGSTGLALANVYGSIANTTGANAGFLSFAISGATTQAASDSFGIAFTSPSAGLGARQGADFYLSGLTAGSNTFTAKYRTTAGTESYSDRKIFVTPLGS